jgi:hypothetical protein
MVFQAEMTACCTGLLKFLFLTALLVSAAAAIAILGKDSQIFPTVFNISSNILFISAGAACYPAGIILAH